MPRCEVADVRDKTSSMGRGLGMGGEYGGGVSTRESMKGEYTAPVHHCHTLTFRDQRGREESKLRRKWQLKGVPLGQVLDEEEGLPHSPNLTDVSSEE